jgi:glucosamine kinase
VNQLIVGTDVGGTATRAAVADLSGRILRVARSGPGNPNGVGLTESAARIRAVVTEALDGLDGEVLSWVLGIAGGSHAASDPRFRADMRPGRVRAAGRVVSDPAIAFSSATPAEEGYVLVAGTGAVAGHVIGGALSETRDGLGWLLGDAGSGYWLGREAVRSTLRALQRGQPLSALGRSVLAAAGAANQADLVAAAYAAHPTWLAGLAPLVSAHADNSADASTIAAHASDRLVETLLSLSPMSGLPIVLGGSVLTNPTPVATRVRSVLTARGSGPVLTADHGVVGALWLALEPLGIRDPEVHKRLAMSAAVA